MITLAVVLLIVTALEMPLYVYVCRRKQLTSFRSVALVGLIFYVANATLFAAFFTIQDASGDILNYFVLWGFMTLYGMALFSPLFAVIIAVAAWLMTRLRAQAGPQV